MIILVTCLVVGVGVGAFLAVRAPTTYTAQTRLFVSSNGSDSTDSLLQNSNLVLSRVPSYVTLVTSPLVVNQVVRRLGLTESPDAVAQRIQATNPLQTALIDITVQDTTARGAYDLAVAIGEVSTSVVQSIETSATGFVPVKVTVISRPELPTHPDLAAPAWRLGLGLLLGLGLGTALAVGRELFDTRLKDPELLRTGLGLPPLAVITVNARRNRGPQPSGEAFWSSPGSEGFRQLRTNVQVLVSSGGLRSVLVTGPCAADGAETVARNLAIAFGMAKVRVLLIDANMRHPRLTAAVGPDGGTGLSAVLAGEEDVDAAIQPWPGSTLHVLPAGPPAANAGELLASEAMEDLLGRLERRFDLLIVDAPPLLEAADAAVLASCVDGVVLSVRLRGTQWDAMCQAVQALHDVQARVLGAAVLPRTGTVPAGPRDALRAPGPATGTLDPVPVPRTPAEPAADVPPAPAPVPQPRRQLRSVPDLPGRPAPPEQAARPGSPLARGVAAVGEHNRAEPNEIANVKKDGTA
jgi:capsular exopolysaccharide synthesis family protein